MNKLTKKEIMKNLEKTGFFEEIWEVIPGLDFEKYFSEAYKLDSEKKEENVLINLSGHDKITFQVSNIKDTNEITKVINELINHIINNSKWFEACKNGTSTLVLPALPILNSMFISAYHGLFGHFPTISWYIRDESGFRLVNTTIDLQKQRDEYRKKRMKLF